MARQGWRGCGVAMALALTGVSGAAQPVSVTPEAVLRPYYDALATQVTLPVAPPNAALAADATLTRVAFGSCNHQSRSQHMWAQIAAANPQLFLLIGDNVYGDTDWEGDAGLGTLRAAYARQAAHPEFVAFRAAVPMLTTWDDHDYGLNDAGGSFAFKGWAERIYETFWNASDEVRARPGIYEARTFGPRGRRVQLIMLDTRYFRDSLARLPYSAERRPLGSYTTDNGGDMLGEAQWRWLEAELAKPADLRLIVSSVQVLTEAHQYEAWHLMPAQREKLLRAVGARNGGGAVLLSGDRHAGGLYVEKTAGAGGGELWEITSSSLNLAFSDTATNTKREPDPRRVSDFISEENFGLLDIDWRRKTVNLQLRGAQGEVRAERRVRWAP